jgi:small subunit ribosomal protein S6
VREYEVTIVINPTIDDEARNEIIERVQRWLTTGDDEGSEPAVNQWGQRALAYPIKGNRDGYYVFYEAKMEPARMHEVEREILYVEDILRHLVVRKNS